MNDDDRYGEDRYGPEEPAWLEPLSRGPIRLRETTTDDDLDRELSDRFSALLEMLGLAATPEGLRDLLFYLLIQKGALLEFVTDGDLVQGGHDGAAMHTFILRHAAAKLKRSGEAKGNVEAAKILAKRKGEARTFGTIKKLLSSPKSAAAQANSPLWSRADRRMPSQFRMLRILDRVATKLEIVTN
jgi:hypothetical protein